MYYVCLYEVRCTIFAKNVKYLQKEFLSSQPLVNIRGKRVNKEVVFANIDVDRLAPYAGCWGLFHSKLFVTVLLKTSPCWEIIYCVINVTKIQKGWFYLYKKYK